MKELLTEVNCSRLILYQGRKKAYKNLYLTELSEFMCPTSTPVRLGYHGCWYLFKSLVYFIQQYQTCFSSSTSKTVPLEVVNHISDRTRLPVTVVIKDVPSCFPLYLLNLRYFLFFRWIQNQTGEEYLTTGRTSDVYIWFLSLRVQFFMFLRRKPKVVLSFVVMLLICRPQSRSLLIVTPKYLLLSTGCNMWLCNL